MALLVVQLVRPVGVHVQAGDGEAAVPRMRGQVGVEPCAAVQAGQRVALALLLDGVVCLQVAAEHGEAQSRAAQRRGVDVALDVHVAGNQHAAHLAVAVAGGDGYQVGDAARVRARRQTGHVRAPVGDELVVSLLEVLQQQADVGTVCLFEPLSLLGACLAAVAVYSPPKEADGGRAVFPTQNPTFSAVVIQAMRSSASVTFSGCSWALNSGFSTS